MKRISLIFGTRPEAIKLCPLVHELRKNSEFDVRVCVTGQHREMLQQVLDFFEITPDINLNLMSQNQSLASFSSKALAAVDQYLESDQPDYILVQGDTSTVMLASLAAFYRQIPVGHVEAGLRSYNMLSPFPEELNRVVTSKVTAHHFAPTETAKNHLLLESIPESHVFVTGNTVIDALLLAKSRIDQSPPVIEGLSVLPQQYILVTGHRRENFGQGFQDFCQALKSLHDQHQDLEFIYPVHLNPNVQEPVYDLLGKLDRFHLIAPVDYPAMVHLIDQSHFIISDSGGVQEEAPALGKPVLVTRDTTERPEGVEAGTAILVGTDPKKILHFANELLTDQDRYNAMASAHNPFGDGTACAQIAGILNRELLS